MTPPARQDPAARRPRQPRPPPHHPRHPGPAHRRPAARPEPGTEDLVAVVDRTTRSHPRSGPALAGLHPPLRHRTHLPLRPPDSELDPAPAPHSRAGRPVDLADHRRLHPTSPRPNPGDRPPTALGETTAACPAHTWPCPPTISSRSGSSGNTSQAATTLRTLRRPSTRHPARTRTPPPRGQNSRKTRDPPPAGIKAKLSHPRWSAP